MYQRDLTCQFGIYSIYIVSRMHITDVNADMKLCVIYIRLRKS